jgi:hypothetical protein
MIYQDSIFGKTLIDDPLVVEIIHNPEFQRLRKIVCQGVPDKYYCFRGFSRYKHSIGVYLILRKLGAGYKEQIAGLLHDISHKAFSHIYDWMIKDYTKNGDLEDAQDKLHANYIDKSTIRKLLLKNKLDPHEIFDLEKYKLLDTEIPYLCADRVEYSIRSLKPKFAIAVLNSLDVKNNRIVCTNTKIAREYAYKFLSLQKDQWGSAEAAVRYYHFSEILKLAIKHKVLTLRDFDLDDGLLVNKIINSKLKLLTEKLNLLEKTKKMYRRKSENTKVVYKKFRHIDPEIVNTKNKMVLRLSDLDKEFKKVLKESKVKNDAGTEFSPLW